MARVEIPETVVDALGHPQGGWLVQVNVRNGVAATVYAAETGGTTLTNPLTTNIGRIEGWLEEGSYDLVVSPPTGLGITAQPYTQRFEAYLGTTAASVALVREAPLNVEDARFGAPTNGTSDATAAIQAAIDLAYSSGGGDVLMGPRRQFAVTQLAKTWTASITVNLIGGGKKSTVLKKFGAGTTPLISFQSPPVQLETYSDMRDFSILGVGKVHHGIEFDGNARLRLTNIDVRGCDKAINNLGGLVMVLTGVNLQGNNDGLVNRNSAQVGGPPPNLVVLSGCVIIGNTHRGIDHGRGQHLILCDGTDVESNGTAGDTTTGGLYVANDITADTGYGMVVVRDAWFEGNLGRAIQSLSGDLLLDSVNLLSSELGRAVVVSGLRRLVMKDCHAPSVGDTVTVDATTASARFEGGVIHTITSACPATIYDDVTDSTGTQSSLRAMRNTKSADYTLVLRDAQKTVEFEGGGAQVLTVPNDSTVPFADGTTIEVGRIGAGAVSIAAAGGVTMQSKGGMTSIDAVGAVRLRKRTTNGWTLTGNLV